MKKTVRSVEEAKAILKEHKDEVVRRYRVSELGIFGSFVRGEQKKRSDITSLLSMTRFLIYLNSLISKDICSAC
jgi:predicted nucleotidyltransferase